MQGQSDLSVTRLNIIVPSRQERFESVCILTHILFQLHPLWIINAYQAAVNQTLDFKHTVLL